MTETLDPLEYAARAFAPKPRRYPLPGALARALDPMTRTSPALDLIDAELSGLAEGRTDHEALAILMPPQEGKSERVSRRFPTWLLDHDPSLRIAIVSYQQDMAVRWGRVILRDIRMAGDRLSISLQRDSAAAARWDTYDGGGVYCVGIGGPLTGKPVDILIIDDPVKDRAAAESQTIRDSTWDWWESVALTRLAPGSRVVLVQTRWHEDDLAGRIAARPSPLRWHTLSIPAIARDHDPLGRQPGEELASVRGRAEGHFARLRAGMSAYVFSGVYQQDPVAPEGNFFRRQTFRYWRPGLAWADGRERIDLEGELVTLEDSWRFITVDVAASVKTAADWTVAACWAMSMSGDLILLDRARDRIAQHDHFGLVAPLRDRWGADVVYVERSFYASTLVDDARAAGVPVAEVRADTDKVTRAIPAAGRVHAGRVWFPAEAAWLDEWTDELAAFPSGAHDDQVDTLSYAARIATAQWAAPRTSPRPGLSPADRAVAAAHQAATGDGTRDLDIMHAQW
jgi:predicted phage terminase large subunit-like protein